jgi:hypothetical protein
MGGSADGMYLAYGASDCSIGILDANDMAASTHKHIYILCIDTLLALV